MSQTTRRDANDVSSAVAMPGGIRKSSRIAAQAKRVGGERVSNIEPSSKPQQRGQGKQIKSKLAEVSTSVNVQPSRVLRSRKTQQKSEGLTTQEAQTNNTNNKQQAQGKRRRGRHRLLAEGHPPFIPTSRKKALAKARTGLLVAKVPTTRNVGTQTPGPAGAPLSEKSLRRLELELEASRSAGYHTHQSGRRDDGMVQSIRTVSTSGAKSVTDTAYKPRFDIELKENGIYEQHVEEGPPRNGSGPKLPQNYETIRDAIRKDRSYDQPTREQYKKYMQLVFKPGTDEKQVDGDQASLFFGWPALLEEGHDKCTGLWTDCIAIRRKSAAKLFTQKPTADRAEGIALGYIPPRIRDQLGGVAVPSPLIGFFNFIVEFKRDGSTYVAHRQNKHAGAVASQAYHEYYTKILKRPEKSWDTARVGSIQFNGDIVVGNVHWVSKGKDEEAEDEPREYHTARIMTHFTFGLDYEDFKTAWRESRNFRDYFFGEREGLLEIFEQEIEARKRKLKAQSELDREVSGAPGQLHGTATAARAKRGRGRPSRHDRTQRKQQEINDSPSSSGGVSGSQGEENAVGDTDSQATDRAEPRRSSARLKRGQERDEPAGIQPKKTKPNASFGAEQHKTQLSQPIGDLGLDT